MKQEEISRDLRPFTISTAGSDRAHLSESVPSMPKLWNNVYNAQCSALSPPDLMEAQPKLLPKNRSDSSSNRNSKYWIFSMIIERSAGPKRVEIGGDDMDTPLEAILPVEPQAEQVCLLRDSPFRILRVSPRDNALNKNPF
ncbi:hypothetical protein ACLKA6_004839 [Drosophila palustris]